MTGRKGEAPRWLALLAACAVTIEAISALVWLRWRFSRYEIAGTSMLPAYRPGDFVVVDRHAYRRIAPATGHVVLARDPREASRELVKRVLRADAELGLWLEGDNAEASTDSRAFGWVPATDVLGRVRGRYWPFRSAAS